MASSTKKFLLRFIFFTVCAAGLLYQLETLFKTYFQYRVTTKVKVYIQDILESPSSTICFSFVSPEVSIWNLTLLNLVKRTNYTEGTILYPKDLKDMSYGDLLRFSANEHDLLAQLMFRQRRSNNTTSNLWLRASAGDIIRDHVHIKKIVFRGLLCFQMQLINETSISPATLPSNTMRFFQFNEIIGKQKYLVIVVSPGNQSPLRELLSTKYQEMYMYNQGNLTFKNDWTTDYYEIVTYSLPAPYESDCFEYGSSMNVDNEIDCLYKCRWQRHVTLYGNHTWYGEDEYDPMDFFVSDSDKVSIFNNMTPKQRKCIICDDVCRKKSCKIRFFRYRTEFQILDMQLPLWNHITPQQPSFLIETSECLAPPDFLILFMSVISTWTGLCVASFNPYDVVVKLRNSIARRRRIQRTQPQQPDQVIRLENKVTTIMREFRIYQIQQQQHSEQIEDSIRGLQRIIDKTVY